MKKGLPHLPMIRFGKDREIYEQVIRDRVPLAK